jgi:hypothetical protein
MRKTTSMVGGGQGLLAILLVGSLASCTVRTDDPTVAHTVRTTPPPPGPHDPGTVAAILHDPQTYMGSPVTIRGRVAEVLGPRTITIRDEAAEPGSQAMLVILRSNIEILGGRSTTNAFMFDDQVEIVGNVRNYIEDEIGRDLFVAVPDRHRQPFDRKPVLLGEEFRFLTGATGELAHEPDPGVLQEPAIDLPAILNHTDKKSLIGRRVVFREMQVFSTPRELVFWMGPNEQNQILVILRREPAMAGRQDRVIEPGQRVLRVEGILRSAAAEGIVSKYNLPRADASRLERTVLYIDGQHGELRDDRPNRR